MVNKIVIYEWANYTTPILQSDLETNTFDQGEFIGQPITFDGGTPIDVLIDDDDAFFEDAYVETGGPQTLISDLTIGGVLYPAGSVVENEFTLIDATGVEVYVVRINGTNVGLAYKNGETPVAGSTFTATDARDGLAGDSTDGTASDEPYANIVCFADGTLIQTDSGPVPIEQLVAGDHVLTIDHGAQPLRWIGSRRVKAVGPLAPIVIRANTFGNPRDLRVSPRHRILVRDWRIELLFGVPEALIAAEHLVDGINILRAPGGEVDYFHMLFDDHQLVVSEGVVTESFHPGAVGMATLDQPQLDEIHALFPRLARNPDGFSAAVRHSLRGFEARMLPPLDARPMAPA